MKEKVEKLRGAALGRGMKEVHDVVQGMLKKGAKGMNILRGLVR